MSCKWAEIATKIRPLATGLDVRQTHRQGFDAPPVADRSLGPKAVEQTHYLRVHIAHLREKIEEKPSHPELIITESAVGYRLLELESGLRPQCRKCVRIQV